MDFKACSKCWKSIPRQVAEADCPFCWNVQSEARRLFGAPPPPLVRREPPPPTSDPGSGVDETPAAAIDVRAAFRVLWTITQASLVLVALLMLVSLGRPEELLCLQAVWIAVCAGATGAGITLLLNGHAARKALARVRRQELYEREQQKKLGPEGGAPGRLPGRGAFSPVPPPGAPSKPDLARIVPPSSPPAAVPRETLDAFFHRRLKEAEHSWRAELNALSDCGCPICARGDSHQHVLPSPTMRRSTGPR